MKEYVLTKAPKLLGHVDRALAGREYLLERFSVADAYLTAVLNWSRATPVQLGQWPNAAAYLDRMSTRPSVAKALTEELELWVRQQAKRKQA
jgi:glutathione S-transferase